MMYTNLDLYSSQMESEAAIDTSLDCTLPQDDSLGDWQLLSSAWN